MSRGEYITFRELYTMDFDIIDLFAIRQRWKNEIIFNMSRPRKSSGIIYLNKCNGQYITKYGDIIDAPCKSLVCLPARSIYSVVNKDCTETFEDAFLVEFNIAKDGKILTFSDSPFLIKDKNILMAAEYVQKVVNIYESSARSLLALKATVYNLLALLSSHEFQIYKNKFAPIAPGINFIEANFLSKVSIQEIADMCNVSVSYFRKLFTEYAGKSPIQYREELRLGMAKNMLEGTDISVEEIAASLGYESSSYFCKLFKKRTGLTPSEYRRKKLVDGKSYI